MPSSSTNPFDDDNDEDEIKNNSKDKSVNRNDAEYDYDPYNFNDDERAVRSIAIHNRRSTSRNTVPVPTGRQPKPHSSSTSTSTTRGSRNVATAPAASTTSSTTTGITSSTSHKIPTPMKSTNPFDDYDSTYTSSKKHDPNEAEPIFACRVIDWPIPTMLTHSTYQRLYNLSLKRGTEEDYYMAETASSTTTTGYVSGFIKTLLVPSATTAATDTTRATHSNSAVDYPQQQHYFVRPPHCVASSNGWIVAVMEVSSTGNVVAAAKSSSVSSSYSSSSSATNTSTVNRNKQKNPLQIISRWNIRRSTMLQLSPEEMLLPLPSSSAFIQHLFIDPTGHHVLLSSINGSLFHLHSSYHHQPKLIFSSTFIVTSVAWDKASGTELSTKNILLGTSNGCIYECCITVTTASNSTNMPSSGNANSVVDAAFTTSTDLMDSSLNVTNITAAPSSSANPAKDITNRDGKTMDNANNNNPRVVVPTCLVDLNSLDLVGKDHSITTSTIAVGSVTGIHVERLSAGRVLVLLVTSGIPHPTRFYAFCSSYDSNSTSVTAKTPSSSSTSYHSVFYGPPIISTATTAASSNLPNAGNTISPKKSVHHPKSSLAIANHYKHSMELPGTIDFASLKVCQNNFAVHFGSGIYYGSFHTAVIPSVNSIIYDTGILPPASTCASLGIFTSIALTPHHVLTISSNGTIFFWNLISHKVIQQELTNAMNVSNNTTFDQQSTFHGEFLMDPRRDQVWLRQGRSLLHISSINEDRDVWRYALVRCLENTRKTYEENHPCDVHVIEEMFDQVKVLCSTQAQKTIVNIVRGEYYLYQHRPELAARYLSHAPSAVCPFTKTALRLCLPSFPEVGVSYYPNSVENNSLRDDEALMYHDALQSYLTDKLSYAIASKDSVSCAMLGAWLTELQLRSLDTNSNKEQLQEKLALFLSKFSHSLDAATTICILQSHDILATVCAPYAAVSGDVSTAVNAALSGEEGKIGALEALRVLNDSPIEKAEPYYYKHAYVLLCRSPLQSCKCFLSRYSQGLQPTKLLPSLMAYERKRIFMVPSQSLAVDDDHEVIKYLEGVIKLGCRNVAIYNYLLSLYADLKDEGPLFRFLSALIPESKGVHHQSNFLGVGFELGCPLDMSFALRKILKTGRHYRSAVKLYMGFGLRQQAVELSLKVDPELARELARESVGKDERKRLWLMIARNAAAEHEHSGEKGSPSAVEKVVSVLKDCGPDVLSIEDVLPFLPDFAQIDQFKDEICDALTGYSTKIDHYLQEMSDCDQACAALREEIARLGRYELQMRSDARCVFSKKCVLEANEPFYVFPSGYVALETPLKKEVLPYLNDKQRQRVEQIEQEISILRVKYNSSTSETDMTVEIKHLFERLQAELNGLIAAECPLTGSIMIESIGSGFDVRENSDFDLEKFINLYALPSST